jgi:hypothetical protein
MQKRQVAIINIFKSLVLIVLCGLAFSIGVFGYPKGFIALFGIYLLAIAYTVLYAMELKDNSFITEAPIERYFYITYGFVALKAIKLLALLGLSVFFLINGKGLGILGFAILLIFVTDVIAFIYKLSKKSFCIALFANYVYMQLDFNKKIFVTQIQEIEFRYDIFYLILKDKKVEVIELEKLQSKERETFKTKFVEWIVRNKINCTEEAINKLNISMK